MRALAREVYRGKINEIERIDDTTVRVALRVPSEVGGFTVREVGLYDDTGRLVAVGNYAATYKPLPDDGSVRELYVRMWLKVSSVDQVTITVDTSIIYATKEWVQAHVDARAATDSEIDEGLIDRKFVTPRGFARVREMISNAIETVAKALATHRNSGDHDDRYAQRVNNLSDLDNAATARVNLGLGTSATLGNTALRTSASTTLLLQAAAMNDHRTSGDHDDRYAQRGNNLSDLASPSQARTNLGLGASATMGTTASRTSAATNVLLQAKAMDDHRQSGDHDERYAAKEHSHAEGDLDLNQLLWGRGSHKLFNNDGSGNAGIAFGADGNIATEPGRPWRIVAQNDSGAGNFTVERADKEVVKGETIRWVVVFELDFSGHAIFKGKINGDGTGLTGTASLRATGTTKADVGLGNVPNLAGTDQATANTLMIRNASGDTWARLFRSSFASTNANIAAIYTTQQIGGDYMRPSTPAQVRDAIGAYHAGNLASAFPRSLGLNQHCTLPGGWIEQSGQISISTAAGTAQSVVVNLPTSFPAGMSGLAFAMLSDTPQELAISYAPINNGSFRMYLYSRLNVSNQIIKYVATGR